MADWSGEPAYKQIADDLRTRITEGQISVGDQLPSLADLMKDYGVSITVARMALAQLRTEGIITTHQGKGAFVRKVPDASEASGPDRDAIVRQLDEMRADIRRLEGRLSDLEGSVHPKRSGRST